MKKPFDLDLYHEYRKNHSPFFAFTLAFDTVWWIVFSAIFGAVIGVLWGYYA